MCGMAISNSLMPDAHAPIEAIDCPNAAKKARKPPRSSSSLLFRYARRGEDDERGDQRKRRLENAKDIGSLLR